MKFIADLHVHSHFSISTAKNLDLENLYIAARQKGITVVGTGDCTHPGWLAEIKTKLTPAQGGLFQLKDGIAKSCDKKIPAACSGPVRFILVSEISNIYKKDGKVRKNHNLVFLPDLDAAEILFNKLDKIGNLKSDGRPILGLDAKNLLDIVLHTADQAFLIPAHIWTPWFSVLGSKSGFDAVEDCFEDLTPHIFALETGLSSDPSMNWRVSALDRFTLVSNSDAHSPAKLGREANLFDTQLTYGAIKAALETGDPNHFLGTLEFHPEEGKYHLDGHRKCNVRLTPKQSLAHNNICPKCSKPLTLGVLYRVEELADRAEDETRPNVHPFFNIIPLAEILSEILQVGPKSKKVMRGYQNALEKLGPEIDILHSLPLEQIKSAGIPLLGEAIQRMRQNKVKKKAGYDGEYGKITVFDPGEIASLSGQKPLFGRPRARTRPQHPPETLKNGQKYHFKTKMAEFSKEVSDDVRRLDQVAQKEMEEKTIGGPLNQEQKSAVLSDNNAILVIAGPGTGKTRTLTHKIAHTINQDPVLPDQILAVAFTNKAAWEMQDRLIYLLESDTNLPTVSTFHAFCLKLLTQNSSTPSFMLIDDVDRMSIINDVILYLKENQKDVSINKERLLAMIKFVKQRMLAPDDNLMAASSSIELDHFALCYQYYQKRLQLEGLLDYEDLILQVVHLLENDGHFRDRIHNRLKYIFIDEYQDVSYGQYRIIKALAPPAKIFAIGDPDQAIYGFSGSDVRYFKRFCDDYPDADVITLRRNYRSCKTIVKAARQIIDKNTTGLSDETTRPSDESMAIARDIANMQPNTFSRIDGAKTIAVLTASSEKAEAVVVGKIIEEMVGGFGFHSLDFGKVRTADQHSQKSFSDFGVLYRTHRQSDVIANVFASANIPHQVVSKATYFRRRGVAELLSLLKVSAHMGTYSDVERIVSIVSPGLGSKTMTLFKVWGLNHGFSYETAAQKLRHRSVAGMNGAQQQRLVSFFDALGKMQRRLAAMTVVDKLDDLLSIANLADSLENDPTGKETVDELMVAAKNCGHHTSQFLSAHALKTDPDTYVQKNEKVTLMTVHAAKGLEFTIVFIVGCEKGYMPFVHPGGKPVDTHEERRLFYVAMTRAKERLYLTYAKHRTLYGQREKRTLSPFVADISEPLKHYLEMGQRPETSPRPIQLKLF
jgi:DNA helicase-2/ATP-dependent DNA helicase PcrA